MNKKSVGSLILIMSVFVIFAGVACAKEKVADVQFVSGNTGGSWASMAAVIADRANQHFEGFPINAVPGGSIASIPLLEKGTAQVGMSQGPFLGAAIAGISPYPKPIKGLNAICSLVPMCVYFLVADEFKGDTLGEVLKNGKGLTIGTTPRGNSSSYVTEYVFDKYGMKSLDEIKKRGSKIVYADQASLQDSWSDRNIDFYTYNTALPSSVISEFLTVRKSRLVALEDNVIERLVKENGFIKMTIPANTFPNQPNEIKTVGMSTVVLARGDLPNIVAYTIAKTVHDEKSYLEAAQAAFKGFDVKDMAKGLVFDIHPGALKYYKEIRLVN